MRSIFLVLTTLISLNTFAGSDGVGAGGGGTSVVCRDQDKNIRSAELLDLYEAQRVHGLKLINSTGDLRRDFELAVARTYALQGSPEMINEIDVQENLNKFFDLVIFKTEPLKLLPDVGAVPELPSGCQLEQLAYFHDSPVMSLEVNKEIWDALDTRSRAALLSHEMLYVYERSLQEPTSESTREMVARIYSQNVDPVVEGLPSTATSLFAAEPLNSSMLTSAKTFSVVNADGPAIRFQLLQMAGRPLLAKTSFDVNGINLKLQPKVNMAANNIYCEVAEPNQNLEVELPLSGSLRKNWNVKVTYITGKPMTLTFLKDHVPVSVEYVRSGCY